MKPNRILAQAGAFLGRLARMLLFPLRGKALYSITLLRRPGEWARRQMDDQLDNTLLGYGICLGLILGVFLGKGIAAIIPQWADLFWGSVTAIALAALALAARRNFDRVRDFKIGHLAELKTAEFLERLGRPEWRVIHGFNLRGKFGGVWDIDHIVVCPSGVFCVETKAVRKFNDEESNGALEYEPPAGQSHQEFGKIACTNGHQDERKRTRRVLGERDSMGGKSRNGRKNPLEQAKDNAGILRDKLTKKFPSISGFYVRRVVVCPGWRVIRKGECWWEFVSSADDLERGEVAKFFAKSKRELEAADIGKIADFLEARVREEKKEINDPASA